MHDLSIARSSDLFLKLWLTPIVVGLIYAIPYTQVPFYALEDHENYAHHARNWDSILHLAMAKGWWLLPFQEPLWFLLLGAIRTVLGPEETIKLVSVLSAFAAGFLVTRWFPRQPLAIIIILSFPLFFANHLGAIRQGVAIAIFFAGMQAKTRPAKILLMGAAPLVHVSFYVMLFLWLAAWAVKRMKFTAPLRVTSILLSCAVFAISLPMISAILNTRQSNVDYALITGGVSGVSFLLWSCILVIFVLAGSDFIKRNLFSISIILLYISSYFLLPFAGRMFEAGILFVLLSGFTLPRMKRYLFTLVMVLFSALLFARVWGQPWLGYGVAG